MPGIFLRGFAAAIALLLFTAPTNAQNPGVRPADAPGAAQKAPEKSPLQQAAELEVKSQKAYEEQNWVRFINANVKLHKLRPYERDYMVNIVRACARLNRASTAYHFMLKMQQQGLTYDFNSSEDTIGIRDTEAYEYINGLLIDAGQTAGEGAVAYRAEGNPANFSAMAWDASRDRLLLGSTEQGAVIALEADGGSRVLVKADENNGLKSIGGLAVPENNRLWIASTALPEFAGFSETDRNQSAVYELDLESMEVIGRYPIPADRLKHRLGSIAATRDGHVYVINLDAPVVYRKSPEGDAMEAFFVSPQLMALSGITVTPDNSRVFVADRFQGIMAIDPIAQQAALVGGPETMNLGRINGLQYHNGMLFVVQGDFQPPRVLRLELDGDGKAVSSVSPMAMALPEFENPAGASLSGTDLYYLANQGAEDGRELIVMSTPIDAGAKVAAPDLSGFENALRARQQQSQD